MNTLTTRTLAALLCVAPLLAQGEKKPDTPASLVEQALYAEEHERDFARAGELFQRALEAARKTNDAALLDRAQKGLDRVAARQRGAGPGSEQDDPIVCSIAKFLEELGRTSAITNDDHLDSLELDIQLYGAIAVPWIEKAIAGQFELCDFRIRPSLDRCVRVLARMGVPESDGALKRLSKSVDPLVRRAVARFARPDAQRDVLLIALQDPTASVREMALNTLLGSADLALSPIVQTHARQASYGAATWLARIDPTALVAIAADVRASDESRGLALSCINDRPLPQDGKHVDALLTIARDKSKPRLAWGAMAALLTNVRDVWRPLEPAIAKQIEDAVTGAPDAYPQPNASLALLSVGGGPAIAAIAGRLNALAEMASAEKQPPQFLQSLRAQLGRLRSNDFRYVATAFRAIDPVALGGSGPGGVYDAVRSALQTVTQPTTPSVDIALGAEGLEGEKLETYLAFAAGWITDRGRRWSSESNAELEQEWIPLLRRMSQSKLNETRKAAAHGFVQLGDPTMILELIALTRDETGFVQDAAMGAIQVIVGADPTRSRQIVEDAMRSYVAKNGRHSTELVDQLRLLRPTDALELAERYWKESKDADVRATIYGVVCARVDGPPGLEFLLRNLPEASKFPYAGARQNAIERFGRELYEPAIDALGEALKDPSSDVRDAARKAFAAFKAQREALAEFAAWKATTNEARATVDELVALLESPNVDVVVGAVKALGALKSSAAYPKLVRLLERKEPAIKSAVQAALDKLGE